MRWTWCLARIGKMINVYYILVGRPRRRWEDNVTMDLREIGWEVVDWINLAQDRDQWRTLANTVMKLRLPYKAENSLTSWVTVSLSRSVLHRFSQSVSYELQMLCSSEWKGYERLILKPKRMEMIQPVQLKLMMEVVVAYMLVQYLPAWLGGFIHDNWNTVNVVPKIR
jgi:hypothetical protein